MSDAADLELDKRREPFSPPPSRRSPGLVLAIVAVLIGAAAAWYFLVGRRQGTTPAPAEAPAHQAAAPEAVAALVAEPGEDIELGPLEGTDPLVRDLVAKLSSHPTVAAWLTTDQLIRNFTLVLVTVGRGDTPARHLSTIKPAAGFEASGSGDSLVMSTASYRRYDGYADAVAALDARGTARLYATLKLRIVDAYRELGHPDGDVDPVLRAAIVELLETPVIETPIRLEPRSVGYDFADPKLQALPSAQRHLLRMGPRNVRLVQAKLREIAPLLGIPTDALPQ